MPLQNRVTPFGDIIADPARGRMMGNRGRLHDAAQRLGRARWRGRAWICCTLSFKGRQRDVMAPDSYTELFFTDEAAALAAGHRPCAECRRAAYRAFQDALAAGVPALGRHWRGKVGTLPEGTFVSADGQTALLLWAGQWWRWAPCGYLAARAPAGTDVDVLTPAPIVAALRQGYALEIPPNVKDSLTE